MGNVGPCGPCSEIHFDRLGRENVSHLVNQDDPCVIEVWNLVFMQYNREANGVLKSLTNQHIDTGMGFERLVSILQNKLSNYDTDIFRPIFTAIQNVTGANLYEGKVGVEDVGNKDTAYRVVADHIRTLVVAISDGCHPDAVDRGYIVRRILRRAVRYGKEVLGAKPGFLSQLVPVIVEQLGDFYGDLVVNKSKIMDIINYEEFKFEKSLTLGLKKFHSIIASMNPGSTLNARQTFVLYDSYGFPEDLTRLMAEERGFKVDTKGFETLLQECKVTNRDRQSQRILHGTNCLDLSVDAISILKSKATPITDDSYKYRLEQSITTTLLAIWDGTGFLENWNNTEKSVAFILDRTSFYAESGGQSADRGTITFGDCETICFAVEDVQSFGGYVCHIGKLESGNADLQIALHDQATLCVDIESRQQMSSNHTATHLINLALRDILGDRVNQRGSLITTEKLRFDFDCDRIINVNEIKALDGHVNRSILESLQVHYSEIPLSLARSINGIRAMFGEKYSNPARVISIGPSVSEILLDPGNNDWFKYSIELCGGTHVENTRDIQQFVIVEEGQHAQGIHRITAFTGDLAFKAQIKAEKLEKQLSKLLAGGEAQVDINKFIYKFEHSVIPVSSRIELRETILSVKSKIQKQVVNSMKALQPLIAKYIENAVEQITRDSLKHFVELTTISLTQEQLSKATKSIFDGARKIGTSVMLFSKTPSKVFVSCMVSPEHIKLGLEANVWIRHAIEILEGKFGGNSKIAQGQSSNLSIPTELAFSAAQKYCSSFV